MTSDPRWTRHLERERAAVEQYQRTAADYRAWSARAAAWQRGEADRPPGVAPMVLDERDAVARQAEGLVVELLAEHADAVVAEAAAASRPLLDAARQHVEQLERLAAELSRFRRAATLARRAREAGPGAPAHAVLHHVPGVTAADLATGRVDPIRDAALR